jgi:hypothetical protein
MTLAFEAVGGGAAIASRMLIRPWSRSHDDALGEKLFHFSHCRRRLLAFKCWW